MWIQWWICMRICMWIHGDAAVKLVVNVAVDSLAVDSAVVDLSGVDLLGVDSAAVQLAGVDLFGVDLVDLLWIRLDR